MFIYSVTQQTLIKPLSNESAMLNTAAIQTQIHVMGMSQRQLQLHTPRGVPHPLSASLPLAVSLAFYNSELPPPSLPSDNLGHIHARSAQAAAFSAMASDPQARSGPFRALLTVYNSAFFSNCEKSRAAWWSGTVLGL